ncbi:MAG: right-handed parallel beta-helix repeat-containing protein [Rhodanobacteraceae bacterium]|nr:right-handed parallel beta-helix repeat-containing protein [Rhodanobacteraceae bacterium]MBL0039794.1 right-handed parallel beta-helix repeat-containing protein [Xanthomonadales bacterium]MBP6078247.1 right-handed parallel beta-helix repeat-containing protein [Xanthomonadales bacterium]MBP7622681.1 right-handed parallel beta-helix repeat-containing protein [Xanthomonadales bacterium]
MLRQTLRCIALAVLCLSAPLRAADYCVASASEFVTALTAAAASNEDDTIKLVGTTMSLAAAIDLTVKGDLTLRGGYGSGCPFILPSGGMTTLNATNTALQLGKPSGDLTLSRLRFSGFSIVRVSDSSWASAVISGRVLVQRSAFDGNGTGLLVSTSHHDLRIENNLFNASTVDSGNVLSGAGLTVSINPGAVADMAVEIVHNTAVGNRYGYSIFTGGAVPPVISAFANNIAHDNRSQDLVLRIPVKANNNLWQTLSVAGDGALAAGSANNLALNPQLDASYRPIVPSAPVINAGTSFPQGGLPSSDHGGAARRVGTRPDIGAYESNVNDAAVLQVTNTNDSGAGSLRQAILDANTNPDTKTIEFNIAGTCPRVIAPATNLPTITSPVSILGYSQPGSARNSDAVAFNGTLCVALVGNGARTTGLHLLTGADETMSVEGLSFNGFISEGVKISGSGIGEVRGNLFGGNLSGVILLEPGFEDAAIRIQDADRSVVGGYDIDERNVIARAAQAGIRLEGGTAARIVRGNLMGFDPTGTIARGNAVGIRIAGGYADDINRNRIGFSDTHGILVEPGSTAQKLRIQSNRIGLTATDAPAGNGGNGLRISAGSEHVVSGNTVRHSGTDGLVVLSAARRVSIVANYISDNTLQAIDLSPDGVNPLNLDVGATGANDDQNRPEILDVTGNRQGATAIGRLSSDNGRYDIAFYKTPECDADGYGEAGALIGHTVVDIVSATPLANGLATFVVGFDGDADLGGAAITAIATDDEGNSSEVSGCNRMMLRDGFE